MPKIYTLETEDKYQATDSLVKNYNNAFVEKKEISPVENGNPTIKQQVPVEMPTEKVERLIFVLKDSGLSPEKIVSEVKSLMEIQAKLEIEKNENLTAVETKKWHRRLKPTLIGLSTVFVLLPLIPGINLLAAYSIASLGAVGFATALYDIYGATAFEAGKGFKDIFQQGEQDDY
ncbi:MAG TPA: hypothetical protein DDY32_08520 [Desulfobulbaceae bacterium]|nr:hypothetical protein [Desulfobulbaceae bacterium]